MARSWRFRDLPWAWIQYVFAQLRAAYFTIERPDVDYLLIEPGDASLADVEFELGSRYFAPNWETSYRYRGEDMNLARVFRDHHPDHPELRWWQVHVRGWETEDGIELLAHYEPEPTEHPDAHLDEHGFDWDHGLDVVEDELRSAGYRVTRRDPSGSEIDFRR